MTTQPKCPKCKAKLSRVGKKAVVTPTISLQKFKCKECGWEEKVYGRI